jgi:hypothetical protein
MRKIRESNENAIRAKLEEGDTSMAAMRIILSNVLRDKDEYIYLNDIVEKMDIYYVMASLRFFKGYDNIMRLYACWMIEQSTIPTDDDVFSRCLETAKAFASGRIHEHEMRMANDKAWDHKTNNYSNWDAKQAMRQAASRDIASAMDGISMHCSYAYCGNEYDNERRTALWNESKDKQRKELIRICECVESSVSPYPELIHVEKIGFVRDR